MEEEIAKLRRELEARTREAEGREKDDFAERTRIEVKRLRDLERLNLEQDISRRAGLNALIGALIAQRRAEKAEARRRRLRIRSIVQLRRRRLPKGS